MKSPFVSVVIRKRKGDVYAFSSKNTQYMPQLMIVGVQAE